MFSIKRGVKTSNFHSFEIFDFYFAELNMWVRRGVKEFEYNLIIKVGISEIQGPLFRRFIKFKTVFSECKRIVICYSSFNFKETKITCMCLILFLSVWIIYQYSLLNNHDLKSNSMIRLWKIIKLIAYCWWYGKDFITVYNKISDAVYISFVRFDWDGRRILFINFFLSWCCLRFKQFNLLSPFLCIIFKTVFLI